MIHAGDIEAQAATWLARRDAVADSGEIPEFTAWLAADPRHRAAYLRLAAAWERSARLKRLRSESSRIDPDLLKPAGARRSFWGPRVARAAGLATIAVSTATVWWMASSGGTQIYRTDIGGLSRVVLKDGSMMTLNTDTELRVRFTDARREVDLIRGEAQFAVAHDASHPFEVLAGGRLVRAVGTAFDVRLNQEDGLEVMVTEGRVAFMDVPDSGVPKPANGATEAPATISAGEAAVATGQKVTVRRVSTAEAARRLAWRAGELSFQGETLSEAVAEFNRYNRRKVEIEDASIAGVQVGGNFQALDVDSFVAALGRSFGITARAADDGTVVLTRGSRSVHD